MALYQSITDAEKVWHHETWSNTNLNNFFVLEDIVMIFSRIIHETLCFSLMLKILDKNQS